MSWLEAVVTRMSFAETEARIAYGWWLARSMMVRSPARAQTRRRWWLNLFLGVPLPFGVKRAAMHMVSAAWGSLGSR